MSNDCSCAVQYLPPEWTWAQKAERSFGLDLFERACAKPVSVAEFQSNLQFINKGGYEGV